MSAQAETSALDEGWTLAPAAGTRANGTAAACAPASLDYRELFLRLPRAVVAVDRQERVAAANHACETLWHAPAAALVESPFLSLVCPEDRARVQEALESARSGASPSVTLGAASRGGQRVEMAATLVAAGDGTVFVAAEAERAPAPDAGLEFIRRLLDGSPELFLYHRDADGLLDYVSPGVKQVLGYPHDELLGTRLERLEDPDATLPDAARRHGARGPQERGGGARVAAFRHQAGHTVFLELIETAVSRDGAPAVQGLARDVTRQKRLEEQLLHEALHDPLTGLPNRALFMDRLEHTTRAAGRAPGALFALLLVDVDDFKKINDRLGHELGDRVLVDIAARLQRCVRPGDTVCRLGGDEFTVLLHAIGDAGDATRVADRIRAELVTPFRLAPHELFVTTSIGIAVGRTAGDPAELVRQADTALYRAKQDGKARYEVFDRAMHESALERLQLESDLRNAVKGGGLSVQYQPVISVRTGRISAFEALVRWRHPSRGTLNAEHFVPVAEDTGLVTAIDRWVIREACRQLRVWQGQFGDRSPRVGVNVSVRELCSPDAADYIRRILAETGALPALLRLEVPESALCEPRVEGALRALRSLGVVVQVDHYGTGGTPPGSLRRLEVDALKMHRSVLHQSAGDPEVLRAILGLAHTLRLPVVAAGVETDEQMQSLRTLECDFAQGNFLCAPVDPDEARRMLARDLGV